MSEPSRERQPTADPPPREVSSQDLLRGERCLVITHGGERYRLIETRNGKLMQK
jgi:hemin uptake protein HemP